MLTRRAFLQTLAVSAQSARRPNILLILSDDLGFECLQSYGGRSYRTPNLDRLAAEGTRFQYAFAQPLCTPTRMQLMTGKSNFRNWKAFGIMDPKERTFGHIFRESGYRTAIAGKWQFWSYNPPEFEPEWRGKGQRIEDAGFDEYCVWHAHHTEDKGSRYGDPTYYENGKLHKAEKDSYGDDVFADFLLRFIETNKTRPWFAYFPMALTHGPFNPTPKGADWKTKRLKNDTAYFGEMVEYMDQIVGRVIHRLDQLGLAENTLVLFYSDNGTLAAIESRLRRENGEVTYRGGKGDTTEAGMRVPLIARWTGRAPAGRVNNDLIDSCDVFATICDASGVGAKASDGRSFLPQIRGEKGQPREWIYSWYDPRPGHDKERWTRTERFVFDKRWKLYEDGRLYDWASDPAETKTVENGAARARLQRVIKQFRAEEAKVRRT